MTKVAGEDLIRRLATRAVHAGHIADPLAGAVMAPIYQTSTYVQQGLGKHKGYEYARTSNPTREALERNIAALEGGRHGFAFASGLAAVDAVLKLLSQGDHVVAGENVYGGTHRQMTHIWARYGLEFSFVDAADARNVAAAVTPRTRMVYTETPTNPMMRLCDLEAVTEIARRAGALSVVDNTFATPCLQRPLEVGADVVLHSTTKYLNGHSDMVGGMLVVNADDLAERIGFIQNASAFTTSMPPTMSLWPFKYLVVECSTTSAPSSRGRWKQGVAKVLSTTESAPARRAISVTASRSHSRIIGLVGVSVYTIRVRGVTAAATLRASAASTKLNSRPYRAQMWVI